jgi:hypothetical protein
MQQFNLNRCCTYTLSLPSLKSRLAKLYMDQLINGEKFERKITIVKERLENHSNSFFQS